MAAHLSVGGVPAILEGDKLSMLTGRVGEFPYSQPVEAETNC